MGDSIIKFLETWSPLDVVLIAQNFDRFLLGAWVTLELTVVSLIVGGALAIPLAIARTSKNPLVNGPVWMFTYTFRGTPLLVQTYLFYYGLVVCTNRLLIEHRGLHHRIAARFDRQHQSR